MIQTYPALWQPCLPAIRCERTKFIKNSKANHNPVRKNRDRCKAGKKCIFRFQNKYSYI